MDNQLTTGRGATGGPELRRRVDASAAGARLDVWLAALDEIGSRSRAKHLVQRGFVRVDGVPARKAGQALESGQEVVAALDFSGLAGEQPPDIEAWPFRLCVLYEDAYIVVIDKPVGLVAHRPDRAKVVPPNVADLATELLGPMSTALGRERAGVVHRLDKDTSGVMVLARTDEASHFLRAQFKARTTRKEYRAICHGEPRFDSDHIDRPIAVHPRQSDRMAVVEEGGRPASTFYEVVERFCGFTHFRCLPKTGRTHQIRVHMTSIGHSLVGDRVYRSRRVGRDGLPAGAPDPGRQCLHALRLGFRHPRTHEELEFDAPLPADMEALLAWLRAHCAG